MSHPYHGLNELRELFLKFFETKGHLRLPSFSLVPQNDKSILLINAGMTPMKPWFTGEEEPPRHRVTTCQMHRKEDVAAVTENSYVNDASKSQLCNWPVQIKLAPLQAPYFDGAKLLIAADCTAYAYANFHKEFIRGKVTLIGCPKLDAVNYSEKLTEILRNNDIQSVTILRMEVPCCGGLEMAAKKAIQDSGKFLPWQVVTISIDGEILE